MIRRSPATTPCPGPDRHDAGGIALTVLLAGALLAGVAVTLVAAATDYLAAAAQARTAADAAALAAAGASPLAGGDGDLRAAATRLAQANGGRLRVCCDAAVGSRAARVPAGGGSAGAAAGGRPAGAGAAVAGKPAARVEVAVGVAPRTALVRALAPEVTVRAAAALRPPEGFDGLAAAAARWSEGAPPAGRRSGRRMLLPAAGPVTSPFGWRTHPIFGTRRLHAGIDIGAPHAAAVHAAADGLVVSTGNRGGYGLTVEIDHGDGLSTLYAHQSRLTVTAGQRVSRGTVIGAVGSTGLSTGPHLHFEVRVHDRPRDPRPYL